MKRLLQVVGSLKTTALLIVVIALLLLLNVAVPQERTLGTEAIDAMAARSPFASFLLRTLGLSSLSTSPVFMAALALFFLNLIAVLVERTIPTIGKISARPPSEETIDHWTASPKALISRIPEGWDAQQAIRVLRGFGYKPKRIGPKTWWGVKHRAAPLGFLIFHVSFFFFCAGGAMIYYTRFVGSVRLIEGQPFDGYFRDVLRDPPLGRPPAIGFTLVSVEPSYVDGEPTDLRATIRPIGIAGRSDTTVWVNHPAKWGSRSILVSAAGIAPEIWLQDSNGFTLDRVSIAAPTRSERSTVVPLANGALTIELKPVLAHDHFPTRDELGKTPLDVEIRADSKETLFEGRLHGGDVVETGDFRLVVADMRYWARFLVVDEKGGGFLVIGFALGVIGAIWRLMTHRRELALTWDDQSVRITGRGEFFQRRFQDELQWIRGTIDEYDVARGDGNGNKRER